MIVHYAALSDVGRRRKENEDNWFADLDTNLFVVSDGMGGRQAGELASRIVVETMSLLLQKNIEAVGQASSSHIERVLKSTVTELSQRIHDEGQTRSNIYGLGATLVMLYIQQTIAFVVHVGDSRAYLFRGDTLTRVTQDHAIVQILLDMGELTQEEAATHPARGQLSRFLGMSGDPLPDVQQLAIMPDDIWLLCSDGLTNMVDDQTIKNMLRARQSLATACQAMIDGANNAGGHDNITVLLVQCH